MSDAIIVRKGGGSGGSLGFTVVGGTARPTKATQNTIWVNTANEITEYVLSANEPESPEEGTLWVVIRNSGKNSMTSCVGDNWITLYPMSAKQYVSGVWQTVEAKSYQDGEWADWWRGGYLYNAGNEYTDITGGWVGTAAVRGTQGTSMVPTITRNSSSMTIKVDTSKGGVVHTKNKIDLSNLSTLTFVGTLDPAATSGYWTTVGVWSEIGSDYKENLVAFFDPTDKKTGSQTVNISGLDGEYYIGLAIYGSSSITMQSMMVE